MRRRAIIAMLGSAALVWPRAARAQQTRSRISQSGPPTYTQTFDQWIGTRAPTRDWRFGTAAAGGIAIKSTTDLATYFVPNSTVNNWNINAEIQRYQPFSNSKAFVFGPDYLALKGYAVDGLPAHPAAMGKLDATGTKLSDWNGSSNLPVTWPVSKIGLADTADIHVGQLVVVQWQHGFYRVVSKTATTVTTITAGYGASDDTFAGRGVAFIRVFTCQCPGGIARNTNSMTVDFVPTGAMVGMNVTYMVESGPAAPAELRVAATDGTTITFDRPCPFALAPNATIVFTPPVHSAQIWTKPPDVWTPGKNTGIFAAELEIKLPGAGENVKGWTDPAAQAAAHPREAIGAWPGFWLYGSDSPAGGHADSSEIDIFEFWNHSTQDMTTYTGFDHGPGIGATVYRSSGDFPQGSWGGGDFATGVQFPLAYHKFQVVWTEDRVYRYIDGHLVSVVEHRWTSGKLAALGLNLSCGSFAYYYAQLFLYPLTARSFETMEQRVKSLKVWALPAAV